MTRFQMVLCGMGGLLCLAATPFVPMLVVHNRDLALFLVGLSLGYLLGRLVTNLLWNAEQER